MVKPKSRISYIFNGSSALGVHIFGMILPLLSLLTFIFSWLAVYPSSAVEHVYARTVIPTISSVAGRFADLVPFSWLDLTIPLGAVLLIVLLYRRKWIWLLNVVTGLYLIFFWTWGLNYHRQPLNSKLQLDS